MFVNFADLPEKRALLLDFYYDFENVEKFGLKNFRDIDAIAEQIERTAATEFPHRIKLVEMIKSQYDGFSESQRTKKNINSLLSPKTFAVVTAQQIGLFGGPLQYFYKIITTIKLAEKLGNIFEDYNFVPVFWLESEDHGFETAHKIYTYNYDKAVRKIAYEDGLPPEENRGSVGELNLGEGIRNALSELKKTLKRNENTDELLALFSKTFVEGEKFKTAFRRLLFELFDERGLVIFDGNCREAKLLVKDLFRKAITDYEELAISGIRRSALLETEYHAHVKIHPVNLYFLDGDERRRIEPHERGFKIGTKRKVWSEKELLELLESAPELFSPDVILRPIVQDYIFPSALIVAGPNEINYFPQVIPYYEAFAVRTPLLYPRVSITINEEYLQKKIEKYNIAPTEIFTMDERALVDKILFNDDEHDLERLFAESAADIDYTMDKLSERLATLDAKLKTAADDVKHGIAELLGILSAKAKEANSVNEQNVLRHVKTLKNQFLPNGKLQEDVINFAYFANQYGLDFLNTIFAEAAINRFEHQIITLGKK
jgi:bacillithiol biosynthesis cysteine-adding enzyme BshC